MESSYPIRLLAQNSRLPRAALVMERFRRLTTRSGDLDETWGAQGEALAAQLPDYPPAYAADTYEELPAAQSFFGSSAGFSEATTEESLPAVRVTQDFPALMDDGPMTEPDLPAIADEDPSGELTWSRLPEGGSEAPTELAMPAISDEQLAAYEADFHAAPTVMNLPAVDLPELADPDPPRDEDLPFSDAPTAPAEGGERKVRITNWFLAAVSPEAMAEAEGEAVDFVESERMTSRYTSKEELPEAVRKGYSLEDE